MYVNVYPRLSFDGDQTLQIFTSIFHPSSNDDCRYGNRSLPSLHLPPFHYVTLPTCPLHSFPSFRLTQDLTLANKFFPIQKLFCYSLSLSSFLSFDPKLKTKKKGRKKMDREQEPLEYTFSLSSSLSSIRHLFILRTHFVYLPLPFPLFSLLMLATQIFSCLSSLVKH